MEAGRWDAPLALRDSAKVIPIISGNGLPLLTENNFQTHPVFIWTPLPVYWYLGYLSDSPPFPYYLELESNRREIANKMKQHKSVQGILREAFLKKFRSEISENFHENLLFVFGKSVGVCS